MPSPPSAPPRAALDPSLAFVLAQTLAAPVPLVPELRLLTASEVTPLWQATERWLERHGVPPPFWAFPWAGGQALARFVLDQPSLVRGLRVLDFASGSGLVAIAAARSGAARVVAVDVDPFARAACDDNARRNAAAVEALTEDLVGRPLDAIDVLLAGDIFYDQADARRFLPWLRSLVAAGCRVVIGDPGRAYAPDARLRELAAYDVPTHPDLEGRPSLRARVLELLA